MLIHLHFNVTIDASMPIVLNILACYSHGTTEELRFFSLLQSFWALKHSTNLALHWVTSCASRTNHYFTLFQTYFDLWFQQEENMSSCSLWTINSEHFRAQWTQEKQKKNIDLDPFIFNKLLFFLKENTHHIKHCNSSHWNLTGEGNTRLSCSLVNKTWCGFLFRYQTQP